LPLAALAISAAAQSGQATTLAQLLGRTGGYVRDLIPELANVVGVEEYVQRVIDSPPGSAPRGVVESRRLTSDFLLVRYPGDELGWMAFRDVTAIDKAPVTHAGDRLLKLFSERSPSLTKEAIAAIQAESTGHHFPGGSYALTNPFVGVSIAQPAYQPRFRFALGAAGRVTGVSVRVVTFQELAMQNGKELTPLFGVGRARGSLSIEEATGRIMKTETQFGTVKSTSAFAPQLDIDSTPATTTVFAMHSRLGLMLPTEMQTTWKLQGKRDHVVRGVATYGNFRRFNVQTETSIPPLPGPQ
jgi:hypothetical protein